MFMTTLLFGRRDRVAPAVTEEPVVRDRTL